MSVVALDKVLERRRLCAIYRVSADEVTEIHFEKEMLEVSVQEVK